MASEDKSHGAITLKGTPVADLKVNDIKRELDKRGLSKAGSKTQLVERLKAQMLLEKLQQDAALSSGDELEGKVPNMALQQEQAGQSEFVRQYLEQQQRNLEKQMEAKKQFEEERKRKSADESSTDEATTPQDSTKPVVDPEVTSPKKFKDDNSNAPATIEPKMPRPARKSSRNASKGENGQEGVATKEKSRSPSPENLRERTRSGSSSSSRSVTPETPGRKGRPTRGARGGRRGGRRGAAARKSARKTSRSSSHSSSEEEFVPKKRSSRAANSISSRSRSRSPQTESVTATRRSSRRVSSNVVAAPSTKGAPEDDSEQVNNGDSPIPKPEVADVTKNVSAETPSEKVSETRSGRRSVEVKEPVAASIETIEPSDKVAKGKEVEDNDKVVPTEKQTNIEKSSTEKEKVLPIPNEAQKEEVQENVNEAKQSSTKLSRWKASRPKNTSGAQEANKTPTDDTLEAETKPTADENNSVSKIAANNEAEERTSETSDKDEGLDKKLQDPNPVPLTESKESEESSKRKRASDSPSGSPVRKKEPPESPTKETEMEVKDSMRDDLKEQPKVQSDTKVAVDHTDVDCDDIPKGQSDCASEELKPAAESHKVEGSGDADVPNKDSTQSEITSSSATPVSEPQQKSDGKSIETNADGNEESKTAADEVQVKKDKTSKKRKWGSKSSKTSAPVTKKPTNMEISSDSLKNLIGEVKLTETVFDIETEVNNTLDYDEQEEDKRDIRINKSTPQASEEPEQNEASGEEEDDGEDARQVEASSDVPLVSGVENESMEQETQDDNDQEPQEEHSKKVVKSDILEKDGPKKKIKEIKKVKKKKVTAPETGETEVKDSQTAAVPKMVATTRPSKPILPAVDEPERQGREVSPARNQPDRVLRIAGLVRPFTLRQLKELLGRTGELDEEHFWINDIKSHCLAAFKTEEDAIKTRTALHGARWPQSNPKILIVDFATIEDVQHRKSGGEGPPPPLMKKKIEEKPRDENRRESRDEARRESREDSRKEALTRDREDRERGKNRDNLRRGTPPREKGGRREPEQRAPQVREWDKDKMKQGSRSRSPSKERGSPMNRPRSKDRDQRKRRDHSRDRKEEDRKKDKKQKDVKAEEEPPAKLLDDLFRKTKATPCIYWLPLTEEQAQQRAVQREEREKEKQKRIAAAEEREKEEAKKREAARLERQKQRERERSRERSTGRDRERGRTDRGRTDRVDRSRQRASRSRSRRR